MREILFRGKRTYDGQWVYGYYTNHGPAMIEGRDARFIVDPKTIGQYTGMHDRNGDKIFEGDIIGGDEQMSTETYFNGAYFGTNTWVNKDLRYVVDFTPSRLQLISAYANRFEIIGNIYD